MFTLLYNQVVEKYANLQHEVGDKTEDEDDDEDADQVEDAQDELDEALEAGLDISDTDDELERRVLNDNIVTFKQGLRPSSDIGEYCMAIPLQLTRWDLSIWLYTDIDCSNMYACLQTVLFHRKSLDLIWGLGRLQNLNLGLKI